MHKPFSKPQILTFFEYAPSRDSGAQEGSAHRMRSLGMNPAGELSQEAEIYLYHHQP